MKVSTIHILTLRLQTWSFRHSYDFKLVLRIVHKGLFLQLKLDLRILHEGFCDSKLGLRILMKVFYDHRLAVESFMKDSTTSNLVASPFLLAFLRLQILFQKSFMKVSTTHRLVVILHEGSYGFKLGRRILHKGFYNSKLGLRILHKGFCKPHILSRNPFGILQLQTWCGVFKFSSY